jgi:hypothetical protein
MDGVIRLGAPAARVTRLLEVIIDETAYGESKNDVLLTDGRCRG